MHTLPERRGSTLLIVIALLGLLTFLGLALYTLAAQEYRSAEYYLESAKANYREPDSVWPHMLEQVIVGASEEHRGSVLYSPERRFSLVQNLLGNDVYPYNGEGLAVEYDKQTGNPKLTNFVDTDLLDFVDSPAARGGLRDRSTPDPDVDYTYPDINNLFLAYKGWAIRQNADDTQTQTPVIIPSFFRPQYMRETASASAGNYSTGFERVFGSDTVSVPTNPHWAYAYQAPARTGQLPLPDNPNQSNRDTVLFSRRSFRPHPSHLAGVGSDGAPVRRYLTDDEADALGVKAGGFPFLPEDRGPGRPGGGNGINGDLGIWTGSPEMAYELDADNDGDGITEGIWLDLGFPVQEFQEPGGDVRNFTILHSVTIYDLDGLFNLNVHGNLAGLPQAQGISSRESSRYTIPSAVADGHFSRSFLSRSHHGLGPNEVNPIWGLRRDAPGGVAFDRSISDRSLAHMFKHFGAWPTNSLQQANMEWLWLLTGRGDYQTYGVTRHPVTQRVTDINIADFKSLLAGRWGEEDLLYDALERSTPRMQIADLPRPGRSRDSFSPVSSAGSQPGPRGFDDNQDQLEGEGIHDASGTYRRPFGHPVSFSGAGRRTSVDLPVYNPATGEFVFTAGPQLFGTDNPLAPIHLAAPGQHGPLRFPGYLSYGMSSKAGAAPRYAYGVDGEFSGVNDEFSGRGGDDLNHDPAFDELFEDPLESIFDQEFADRNHDRIAAIGDLVSLQWPKGSDAVTRLEDSEEQISTRLTELAPHAFALSSDIREMFTTHSNSLRHFPIRRSERRPWEFSADTDGHDRNRDGLGDGDGRLEFPPAFGSTPTTGQPYTRTDPFRAPVRRLLTNEIGETRQMPGSLPLSINHILDVNRTATPPPEGTPEYLRYMQRSGLRFRSLTEHPIGSDDSPAGRGVLDTTTVPTLPSPGASGRGTVSSAAEVPFPPQTVSHQEFWARRDRQQLARDIYVLLYTLGGARQSGGMIRDYTGLNDPDAPPESALYSHQQLRAMAQFAVNLVDAMDTDAVITKFEYDKNLGDGWNLDDDPFSVESAPLTESPPGTPMRAQFDATTAHGRYREDTSSRGVVFGVEAQHVALNEVLAVRCAQTQDADHAATLHDDKESTRDHLFVELINVQPQTLPLATSRSSTAETGIFRLARFDRDNRDNPLAAAEQPVAAVTFLSKAGEIRGGEQFTVAAAGDKTVINSDLFIDANLDGSFELIAPNVPASALPTRLTDISNPTLPELSPRSDLDLIHPRDSNARFVVTDPGQQPTSEPGAFLSALQVYGGNAAMDELSADLPDAGGDFIAEGSRVGFDLVLQRRLNPNMPSLEAGSGQAVSINPWIEIDRIRVEFADFGLQDGDTAEQLQGETGRLSRIRSFERKEPLDDSTRRQYALPLQITDDRFNSIGSDYNVWCLRDPQKRRNEAPSSVEHNPLEPSRVWQPHFDRDFTSPGELLNLPLIGPDLLTQRLRHSQTGPQQQFILREVDHRVSGAAAIFLRPEFDSESSVNIHLDNRWYRLFQFVEVPSRLHRMLGNYLNQTRVPGKINLNMIRHQEVLAGLIDDPMFADTDANRLESPFLADQTPGAYQRDRWVDFIQERDGVAVESYFDPTPWRPSSGDEATKFLIPGTPGSRPFRSYSYTHNSADDNGIEHTILRRLMQDRDEDADGDDDELDVSDPDDDDDHDLLPDDNLFGRNAITNRHWLEVGSSASHTSPAMITTPVERHQVLSKIMNNTTTVSHVFVVFATAANFEVYEDPSSGLYRIGGRIDLDGDDKMNPGWQQRAVFVIDRTEALDAYDPGTGSFDWERLVRYQAVIE